MKVVNKALLAEFRTAGACEYCKRPCRAREPHHLFTRGAGQLDIRINLIALGSAFQCTCHRERHDGNILHCDMLAVVAARENVLQDHITDVIHLLRRLPKKPRPWQIEEQLEHMGSARPLAVSVLQECWLIT